MFSISFFSHLFQKNVLVAISFLSLVIFSAELSRRFIEKQREIGRIEVKLKQTQLKLEHAQATTAHAETLYVEARETARAAARSSKTTQDRVRESLRSRPETSFVMVRDVIKEVETLVTVDSIALSAANLATVAADSVAKAERAEKLIWKEKAETRSPTIIAPRDDKWRRRAERGALVGVSLALLYTLAK